MATLHIINKTSAENCTQSFASEDTLLLIQDGVYCGLSTLPHKTIYALNDDVNARGIANKINSLIEIINYQQFVELTTTHSPIISW